MQLLSHQVADDEDANLQTTGSQDAVEPSCLETISKESFETIQTYDDPIFDQIRDEIDRKLSSASSHLSLLSVDSSDDGIGAKISDDFTAVPYGFQPRAAYEHSKKQSNIVDITFNARMRQFVILDGKGITTWRKDAVENPVTRALNYPKYEYRLITTLIFAKKYNVYFGLGKDFSLKVLNKDFNETCCVSANLQSVLFMVFNPVKDELVTGGVGGTKIWNFHQAADRTWKEIKPMANYTLSLKYELKNVGGSWVKKVELDPILQHLYCCSDTDLYAYDLDGNLLFRLQNAHTMSITGCAYSHSARLLVTCSVDADVKLWSITGGHIHTFRGHSRAITNLILHPDSSSLVLTSSLDGSIRLWSLDTMDSLYSIVVSSEGVKWMGLTDDKLLYIGTPRSITVWSLNNTYQFWALARNEVTSVSLVQGVGKSTRVLALGNDSSVRLFARGSHKNLSTVLPPPPISPLQSVLACCYSRSVNVVYLLINHSDIWLYTTRTDPACRIAVWNIHDIQESHTTMKNVNASTDNANDKNKDMQTKSKSLRSASSTTLSNVMAVYRATENGYSNESISDCCSLCLLESSVEFHSEEGLATPLKQTFLLLGLGDGRILFMDPVVKGLKYLEFRANKDAIKEIKHDTVYKCLITLCNMKEVTMIQIWSLPELVLQHDVFCAQDITSFSRLDSFFMTGHHSGGVVLHHLTPADDPGPLRPRVTYPAVEQITPGSLKADHKTPVVSIDACTGRNIFCSCSYDGAIKIWLHDKTLLTEITMDETFSCACFFNSRGDLLVGMKNHIFMINASKVCPSLISTAEEEDDLFETESDIYEDPAVVYEGVSENQEPVDMDNYLIPFNMEFSREFLEGHLRFKQSVQEDESESESESDVSMAPTELYISPYDTPRASKIDLTLSSEITEDDLAMQMAITGKLEGKRKGKVKVSIADVVEMAQNHYDELREFPQFGISPGPTPDHSEPSTPGARSEVDELSEGEETMVEDDDEDETERKNISRIDTQKSFITDADNVRTASFASNTPSVNEYQNASQLSFHKFFNAGILHPTNSMSFFRLPSVSNFSSTSPSCILRVPSFAMPNSSVVKLYHSPSSVLQKPETSIDVKKKQEEKPRQLTKDHRRESKLNTISIDVKALLAEEMKKMREAARTDVMVSFVPPTQKPESKPKREIKKKMPANERKMPKKGAKPQKSRPSVPKLTQEQKEGPRLGEMYGRASTVMKKNRVRASITNIPSLREDENENEDSHDISSKVPLSPKKSPVTIKPRRFGVAAETGASKLENELKVTKPADRKSSTLKTTPMVFFSDKARRSSMRPPVTVESQDAAVDDVPDIVVSTEVTESDKNTDDVIDGQKYVDEQDSSNDAARDVSKGGLGYAQVALFKKRYGQIKRAWACSSEDDSGVFMDGESSRISTKDSSVSEILASDNNSPDSNPLRVSILSSKNKKSDGLSFRLPSRSRSGSFTGRKGGRSGSRLDMELDIDIEEYDDGGNFTDDDDEEEEKKESLMALEMMANRPFTSDDHRIRKKLLISAKSRFRPSTAPLSSNGDSDKDTRTQFNELVAKHKKAGSVLKENNHIIGSDDQKEALNSTDEAPTTV